MRRQKETVDLPLRETLSASTHSGVPNYGGRKRSTVRSIGIDLGKKPVVCEVADGKVVFRQKLKGLDELVRVIGPGTGAPARVAFEACREAWAVADWLEKWGHEPLMVDTTRAKQMGIGQHGRKNDDIDAEVIARAVEENRVPLAHLLSKPRQLLRRELGLRRALVEMRVNLIVTVRGAGREEGIRLPGCDAENFAETFEGAPVPADFKESMLPAVATLKDLNARIAEVEQRLERLCDEDPAHELLKTGPGAGPIVCAAFISVIDDPKRFETAHQVESYLGLVPSEDTSGKRKLGSITKQGNKYLRAVLTQAAWSILRMRREDPLKLWGQQIMARRGKRVAAIAVARRLAGVLWAMWKRGTVYDPGLLGMRSAAGLEAQGQSTLLRAEALKRASAKRLRAKEEAPPLK
jgi:transposase